VGHFCPPGSGSAFPMRIRIQLTITNADPCDPDQKYWFTPKSSKYR
jgi:hypothetical protein